jgi:endonuclease YncB( thermonuclease family)
MSSYDGSNWRYRKGRRRGYMQRKLHGVVIALAIMGAVAIGSKVLDGTKDKLAWLSPAETKADGNSASFTICGDDRRINCVVDGDTFWFAGTKIRIADIDTPELSPARCSYEKTLGLQAKARLQALLNKGPFSLAPADRDTDKYGRKLRIVNRNGSSIGDVLISEGLARPWIGHRDPWCT